MRYSKMALILGVGVIIRGPSGASVGIEPMVGAKAAYTVRKGDTLVKIARRNNLTQSALMQVNHLPSPQIRPGQRLTLPSLYILPRNPKDGIVLNVPERQVYLFEGGVMRAHYPVCVGKPDPTWQTALGTFTLTEKKTNPVWEPTKSIVQHTGIKDEPVPAGPENPLGDRWMGWSKPGFGFHSTITPQSIGLPASHGCVRLYPESAHAMFDRVKEGMTIYAVYEPVEVGQRGGKFYLSVFPDIYKQDLTTLPHVQKILRQENLLALVSPTDLKRIVHNQNGVPQAIIGTDQKIKVNGKVIALTLAPAQVRGSWIVSAKEIVTPMGGQMAPDGANGVKITGKGHTLIMKEGQRQAKLDGKTIVLPLAPVRIKGILLAPLGPLAQACGVKVSHPKGQAIALKSLSR